MTDKGVVESATKNYRTRVVVLPQLIYDYLGELLFNQIVENNGVQPGDLIFAKQGKPIHPDTFSRHLRKLYDRNGFPKDYHLHTMRHTNARLLIAQGVDVHTVASLRRHSRASTTLDMPIPLIKPSKKLRKSRERCWGCNRKRSPM